MNETQQPAAPADTRVAHWHGRPVTELSRDELIAALNEVGDELHRLYEYIRRDPPWRQFMPK